MKKKKPIRNKIILIGVSVVLLILIVWGVIGSSISSNVGITCDFGLGKDGSIFCWKWHKNLVGQVGDVLGNLLK